MKVDLKNVLNNICAKYSTKEDTLNFFLMHSSELGVYGVDSSKKAAKFRDEKTASTHFLPNLRYTDFGGDGQVHDVVHRIMEVNNCNFPEAVKILAQWENEPMESFDKKGDFDFSTKQYFDTKEIKNPYKKRYLDERRVESKKNKKIAFELLKGLCRSCNSQDYKRAVKMFSIGLVSYERSSGEKEVRLFIPEFDEKEVAWGSFSYNRSLPTKGLLRKSAKRVLFGSHLIKYFDPKKPIIFAEGHSDCIVNNAKCYACVTTGSATTPLREWMFPLLEGRMLHFYPDADEAGMRGVLQKLLDIESYNATVEVERHIKYQVFWWSDNIVKKDGTFLKANELKKIQQDFFTKKRITPTKEMLFNNWKIIKRKSNTTVKVGYDFIDFHTEYKDSPEYAKYMDKYSFEYQLD